MDDQYRPTTRRQRLVIILVAVSTVVILWFLLIERPGGHPRVIPPAAPASAPAACAKGETEHCVGGKADVMLIPATPQMGTSPAPMPSTPSSASSSP